MGHRRVLQGALHGSCLLSLSDQIELDSRVRAKLPCRLNNEWHAMQGNEPTEIEHTQRGIAPVGGGRRDRPWILCAYWNDNPTFRDETELMRETLEVRRGIHNDAIGQLEGEAIQEAGDTARGPQGSAYPAICK